LTERSRACCFDRAVTKPVDGRGPQDGEETLNVHPDPSSTTGPSSASDPVTVTRQGHIGVITLNRPQAMNAVNAALATAAGEALEQLDADDAIRVVVLTGAGRAFCAGMDLKAFAGGEQIDPLGHPEWGFAGIVKHPVATPTIAAVNGPAMGGGAEIVLTCDLVVASTAARFGLPEVKRGLFAGGGGLLRLPRQLPRRVAMELILTGDPIDAERALEHGLVNQVVAPDDLLPAALALAERIAVNAPLAVRLSKQIVRDSAVYGDDWSPEIWQVNDALVEQVVTSADASEGARAFAEKRDPVWTGR
jgi:crotonobetainyl-CoA hydratase